METIIMIIAAIKMIDFGITAAAIGAGAAIAGQGIQMGATKLNNTKNFNRQKQLMDKQFGMNQQAAAESREAQYDLWQRTGPVGQMEQLKKAGLNPGLMYGKGDGGGGMTAATPTEGPGSASYHGENPGAGAGQMGIVVGQQLALLNAQKENLEADTQVKLEDARNKAGDTANKPSIGENLRADTELKKQNTLAAQVSTDIQKLQLEKNNATFNDEIQLIMRMRQQAGQTLERQVRENKVDEATKNTRIKQVDADYAATLVGNELTRQKIGESQSNVRLNDERVLQVQNDIRNSLRGMEINWQDLNQKGELIKQQVKALQNAIQMNDTPASTKAIQDLGKIMTGVGTAGMGKPNINHFHEHINYGE